MTRHDQWKIQAIEEERAMLMSGSLHDRQNGQYLADSSKTSEPSALASLTNRLKSQVALAQSIEKEVESITRRLGGSMPSLGNEATEAQGGQIITPRIDELNGLIDLLSQTLARTEAEAKRLRRMVE